MSRILILGGTREAARLATTLVAEGHDVTTSLAGRTREPKPVDGKVRTGGFGGAEGLASYLRNQAIDRVIDATHPFAVNISANAARAAKMTGTALEVRERKPWIRHADDNWLEVPSLDHARDAIPPGARALLALGSQHIAVFTPRGDVHFLVRMIDPPQAPLPLPDHELVLGRPGTTAQEECEILEAHHITHVVCRNSGGSGAYAKIEAARKLCLPVIMVSRPENRNGKTT